jgi:hypothetical protein
VSQASHQSVFTDLLSNEKKESGVYLSTFAANSFGQPHCTFSHSSSASRFRLALCPTHPASHSFFPHYIPFYSTCFPQVRRNYCNGMPCNISGGNTTEKSEEAHA